MELTAGTARRKPDRLRWMARACALPLLAVFMLAAAVIVAATQIGTERAHVQVEASRAAVEAALAGRVPLESVVIGADGATCGGRGVLVSIDGIEPAVALQGALQDAGLAQCEGTTYQFNMPPRNASRWTFGWQFPAAFLAAVAVAGWVYRRFGLRTERIGTWRTVLVVALAGAMAIQAGAWGVVALFAIDMPAPDPLLASMPLSWPVVLAIAVGFPVIEELAFRAWLIPFASRAVGPTGAVLLSSGAFAVAHIAVDLAHLAFYAFAGLVLSLVWQRTRSLAACVAAHSLYNLGVALLA